MGTADNILPVAGAEDKRMVPSGRTRGCMQSIIGHTAQHWTHRTGGGGSGYSQNIAGQNTANWHGHTGQPHSSSGGGIGISQSGLMHAISQWTANDVCTCVTEIKCIK